MCNLAGITGQTNHSLRATAGTCLFHAGKDTCKQLIMGALGTEALKEQGVTREQEKFRNCLMF